MTSTNGSTSPAPPTDAERLMGADIRVPLAGGVSPPLVYDFHAWALLESELGGLSAIAEALAWGAPHWVEEWVEEDVVDGDGVEKRAVVRQRLVVPKDAPLLETVGTFLAAGLAHAGLSKEEVQRRLLLSELGAYKAAIVQATDLAWPGGRQSDVAPDADDDGTGEGGLGKEPTPTGSTGPASTT